MKIFCVKCRRDTENIDPKTIRTKNNRFMIQSKCPVCGIKKSRFVKEQEAKSLLSNLGIKATLRKVPMHLKQPGFTYSVFGPFTKNKKRIEKFMQTGNTDFICKNELDKACFQHDMA